MEHKKTKMMPFLLPAQKITPKTFPTTPGTIDLFSEKKSFRIKCQDVKRKEKNMYKGVIYSSGQNQVLILLV